jgi:TolA-binding protein
MKQILGLGILGLALVLAAGTATPVAAQATVSASDIQRLQDRLYDASSEVARVRARNADEAARMQSDLDDLRDEAIYLKVKLRKEGSVSRTEYSDLRDRIDQVSSRARSESGYGATSGTYGSAGGASTSAGSTAGGSTSTYGTGGTTSSGSYGSAGTSQTGTHSTTSSTNAREVPVGTELDVKLQTTLNSGNAQPEQRFEATTAVDLKGENGQVLVPAGSLVRGVVSDVKSAGRVERKASMTLAFDQITIRGRNYPIRATVAPFEGEGVKGDVQKIGTGAGVGAIIGGILGGFKGALAGILIGGGGVVAATEGQEVNLPAGTMLRLRFDSPLNLR